MELLTRCPVCKSETVEHFSSCKDHFLSGEPFSIDKCTECGLLFTNPRPEKEHLGKYYQSPEYISHSNSTKGNFNFLYQLLRKLTIRWKYRLILKHSTGNSILDVGCATGEFLGYMKNKNWQTLGIEPEKTARERGIQDFGLDIRDESYLSTLQDNSMDVITLWHVLEHVSNLEERMSILNRILKPGGILMLAVPNSESYDAIFYKEFWAGYDVPRHLYHFTPSSMKKLLDQTNFSLLSIIPMRLDAFYVSMLSEKYKRGKMKWLPGFWNGYCSNWKARKTGNFSSLIFISKKEQAN